MSLRLGSLVIGAAAVLASFSFASNDAQACGGCFHEPTPVGQQDQATVVTGHRMALSVSTERTVLWDQIQYAGKPQDFAWVLPIKPGAYLELASDAFFEALDAATSTTVRSPQIECPASGGFGGNGGFYEGDGYSSGCNAFSCGAMSAAEGSSYYEGGNGGAGGGETVGGTPPDPVTVVHNESIGPYETVTIHSNIPGALFDWLDSHGYAVDDAIKPMIDDYETEGFDFIALRLIPGEGVRQMQPVRVVSPGASPVLPLRMVAAGTGANVAITLFVIGEGRWATQNFPSASISNEDITWDFSNESSDYATVRAGALAQGAGDAWLTPYARLGSMLNPIYSDGWGGNLLYTPSAGGTATSIYELYMMQGIADGIAIDPACVASPSPTFSGNPQVVEGCVDNGGGGTGGAGAGGMGAGGMPSGGAGGVGGAGAGGMPSGGAGGVGGAGTGGTGGTPCTLGPDQLDASIFACGQLDDIAAALVGLHPADVWVTRLEANLPHAALTQDLALQADPSQSEKDNWLVANGVANPPCSDWQYSGFGATAGPPRADIDRAPRQKGSPPSRGHNRDLVLFGVVLLAVASAAGRRLARPRLRMARAPQQG